MVVEFQKLPPFILTCRRDFESQTAINQSTHAEETHHSFGRQFHPTVENHFLSVKSRSPNGPSRSYMSDRKKRSGNFFQTRGGRHTFAVGPYTTSVGTAFLSLRHISCPSLLLTNQKSTSRKRRGYQTSLVGISPSSMEKERGQSHHAGSDLHGVYEQRAQN